MKASCGRLSVAQSLWAALFIGGSILGEIVLRRIKEPTPATTAALVLIPILAGVFYLWWLVRDLSHLDELQRRFWTEGAVVGCAATFILLMTYPLLEEADWVGPINPPLCAAALFVFTCAGYFRAWSRYR
ncbi:MAG TPA: hypothetical protein VE621_01740 [Bryobacteraceae bacterium]|nr:hypothetical protein [Bryobacteraceae bacterium]